jgi:hypothetical protein
MVRNALGSAGINTVNHNDPKSWHEGSIKNTTNDRNSNLQKEIEGAMQ